MNSIVMFIIMLIAFAGGSRLYHLIYGGTIYFGKDAGSKRVANYIICVLGVGMAVFFIAGKLGLVELPNSEEDKPQQVQEESHNGNETESFKSSFGNEYFEDNEYENGYGDSDYEESEYEDTGIDDDSMAGMTEEYVFYDSDKRFLTDVELAQYDADTLRVARNEIYARHGRRFDDKDLQEYFESTSWYEGTVSPEAFDESVFNKYEKKNLKKIKHYEK